MKVRHFLGCDPCAKPAPHDGHVWIAEARTVVGIRSGRTYRHSVEDLTAEIRKDGGMWVITVDRGDFSHEERHDKSVTAARRWIEICAPA